MNPRIEALKNLSFNINHKSNDYAVNKKYYDNDTKRFCVYHISTNNKLPIHSFINDHYENINNANAFIYGLSMFKLSSVIVIDYDIDHDTTSTTPIKSKEQVLSELRNILGQEYYIEYKISSDNFHAYWRYDKNITKQQKKDLQAYLKSTISNKLEVSNCKNVPLSLPQSYYYIPQTSDWCSKVNDYVNKKQFNNADIMLNNIPCTTSVDNTNKSIFQRIQNYSFMKTFEFTNGNRNEELLKYGFMMYKALNQDEELLKDFFIERAGTSKELNSNKVEQVATSMAHFVVKGFKEEKTSSVKKAIAPSTINTEHLDLIQDKHIQKLDKISELIFDLMPAYKYKVKNEEKTLLIKEAVKFIFSYFSWRKSNPQIVLNNVKLTAMVKGIIQNSMAFNKEVLIDYLNKFNFTKVSVKMSVVKLEEVLVSKEILTESLAPCSHAGIEYKRQYYINFDLDSLDEAITRLQDSKTVLLPWKTRVQRGKGKKTKEKELTMVEPKISIELEIALDDFDDICAELDKFDDEKHESLSTTLQNLKDRIQNTKHLVDETIENEIEYKKPEERLKYIKPKTVWSIAGQSEGE